MGLCNYHYGLAYRGARTSGQVQADKDRHAAAHQQRVVADPDHVRSSHLRLRYGLTIDQWNTILTGQDGCAICHKWPSGDGLRFHVDHDHACCPTSKTCGACIRGILCHNCNVALGHLFDSRQLVTAALQYLEGF